MHRQMTVSLMANRQRTGQDRTGQDRTGQDDTHNFTITQSHNQPSLCSGSTDSFASPCLLIVAMPSCCRLELCLLGFCLCLCCVALVLCDCFPVPAFPVASVRSSFDGALADVVQRKIFFLATIYLCVRIGVRTKSTDTR